MTMALRHEQHAARGAFSLVENEERLATMSYARSDEGLVVVDHTEVSERLRGQGAGRQLLDALVAWVRETGAKVGATCPYAKAQLEKDAAFRDVLAT